jgi:hypothetical protein
MPEEKWEYLGVDGRIILKRILEKQEGMVWPGIDLVR